MIMILLLNMIPPRWMGDIRKYEFYVYDDFKDYIRNEIFDMLPIPYLKLSVGKGLTTKEKIIGVMEKYLSFM